MQHPSIDVLITNVEIKQFESGNQYKITGDTNQGSMKFKFYQTKADGTEGSAYQQWRSMGLKIGSTVNVAYSEEQKEYQGKPYTDRRVIWFRETIPQPRHYRPMVRQIDPLKTILALLVTGIERLMKSAVLSGLLLY